MHSPQAQLKTSDDRSGLRGLLLELAHRGRQRLDLLLHRPETDLMDHPDLLAEIRRLALGHHGNRIRLCVLDAPQLARDCPRLLDLMQRLPSRCEMRTPEPEYRELSYDLAIADRRHLLYRSRPERYEANLWLDDPAGSLAYAQEFEDLWQHSMPVSDLRRLGI